MDISTIVTAVVAGTFTFAGGLVTGIVASRSKRMEVYDQHMIETIDNYYRFANMCIADRRCYREFLETSSKPLPHLTSELAEQMQGVTECIRNLEFESASKNLFELSVSLQKLYGNKRGRSGKNNQIENKLDKQRCTTIVFRFFGKMKPVPLIFSPKPCCTV